MAKFLTAMSWAVALDRKAGGRTLVLLVLEERSEAESIALEMRNRGQRVVVHAYPDRDQDP